MPRYLARRLLIMVPIFLGICVQHDVFGLFGFQRYSWMAGTQ